MTQGLCDTTLTERFDAVCVCDTYAGNKGPCKTYELGANGRCVYCDHASDCHPAMKCDELAGKKVPLAEYRKAFATAQAILLTLNTVCAAPKPRKHSTPLRSSSSMIRIQQMIDRNEEIANARDACIDSNLDGVPVKLAPVAYNGDVLVCAVFRAARTCFGRHTDTNFHLVEKHFGIGYEPILGKRMIINVAAI